MPDDHTFEFDEELYKADGIDIRAQLFKGENAQWRLRMRSMPGLSFSTHPMVSVRDLTVNVGSPKEGTGQVIKNFPYTTDIGLSGVIVVVISNLDTNEPIIEIHETTPDEA